MKLIPTPYKLDERSKHIEKVISLENAIIMNIQLKKGESIAEHDSKKDVMIVVKSGAVIFNVEGTETLVTKNTTLYIAPFEKHGLLAMEDVDILVFQIMP